MKIGSREWWEDGVGYYIGLIFAIIFCLGALGVFFALMTRVVLWAWVGLL